MTSVKFEKSDRKGKKMKATFIDRRKTTTIHFGAEGMSDFTQNKDSTRKKNYLARHKKNENWNDPMTAGALSRFILWNKPTIKDSIQDFKGRFNLK